MSYDSTKEDTSINTYFSANIKILISSNHAIKVLREMVQIIGEGRLGFKPSEIGTHSI